MSIDVNKFRAGAAQVSGQGGFVATNTTGDTAGQKAATVNGTVNVQALRATSKSVEGFGGSVAKNQLGSK